VNIGAVPYWNVRPLIYGIEDRVTLLEPAALADAMHRRQFDAGMVPLAEVLAHDQYDVLDGIAIAARGAVRSVFLAHRVPLAEVRRVAVTPASRTSVWLLHVLFQLRAGRVPRFYPKPPGAKLSEHEAMLLIGDEALRYAWRDGERALWDLGAAWVEQTGLPFVFAVWAFQRGLAGGLPAVLRQAKAAGLAHLEEIVQNATDAAPELLREYYARCVWYDLDDAAKEGIRRFQRYLQEFGLIQRSHDLRYIA
jgi:predicted solute-binding protein